MIIEVCVYCNRTEIDWRPMEDEDDEPAYICTVCTDQQRVTGFRRSFVALHRNLLYGLPPHFPQELFGYVFPGKYRQWLSMNSCKRAQRTETGGGRAGGEQRRKRREEAGKGGDQGGRGRPEKEKAEGQGATVFKQQAGGEERLNVI